MAAAVICDNFGWTYEQYISAPKWLIELIQQKRKAESNYQEKKGK